METIFGLVIVISILSGCVEVNSISNNKNSTDNPSYKHIPNKDLNWKTLVGIPMLGWEPKKHDETRKDIHKRIMERLPELEHWTPYDSLKPNKVIAIRYSFSPNTLVPYIVRHLNFAPYVSYWGGSWEYDSLPDARRAALSSCKKVNCIIYLENDEPVGLDALVIEHDINVKKFIESQSVEFDKSTWSIILDDAIRLLDSKPAEEQPKYRIPLKEPISIFNPDHLQDYDSVCLDSIFYTLLEVPKSEEEEVINRLGRLLNTDIYGHYMRSVSTLENENYREPKEGRMMTKMARFANYTRINSIPNLPWNLEKSLEGEEIKELWAEGAVRVSENNLPLDIEEHAKPLAIRTNLRLLLGVESKLMIERGAKGCLVSSPFTGKKVNLSICQNDLICGRKVLNVVLRNIKKVFEEDPFYATELNEIFAPGEVALVRDRKQSHILGDSSYEKTTYFAETWISESDTTNGSLYGRADYKGVTKSNFSYGDEKYLFLKARYVHTNSAHRNGTFSEPSDFEISKYNEQVDKGINTSIISACKELKGQMDDGVCIMTTIDIW